MKDSLHFAVSPLMLDKERLTVRFSPSPAPFSSSSSPSNNRINEESVYKNDIQSEFHFNKNCISLTTAALLIVKSFNFCLLSTSFHCLSASLLHSWLVSTEASSALDGLKFSFKVSSARAKTD